MSKDLIPVLKDVAQIIGWAAHQWLKIFPEDRELVDLTRRRKKIKQEIDLLKEGIAAEPMPGPFEIGVQIIDEGSARKQIELLNISLDLIDEEIAARKKLKQTYTLPPELTEGSKEALETHAILIGDITYELEKLQIANEDVWYAYQERVREAEELQELLATGIAAEAEAIQLLVEQVEAGIAESTANMKEAFDLQKTLADQAARNTQDAFASFFYDAFKGELKDLGDYWDAFWDSMLQAFANMCAQMLVEWLALQAAMAWTGIGGWLGGLFHGGGIVGITPTPFKIIPEQAVATAPRYHAGLKPDERVGILQVGEIVLPKEISESLLAASEEQVIQIHNYLDGREVSVNVIRRIERDSTLRSRYRRGLGVK